MTEIVIDVRNISKEYSINDDGYYLTVRDSLVKMLKSFGKKRPAKNNFWALKNISFQVKRGEILGVIGRNGAGKSTLLKVLARITEPTGGEATIRGRVASMLEVGTGFNPELTGRENVYLNGAILGMSRQEIKNKFDTIIEFSGVKNFIDTPVKHYSSGMYMRLAFAVAAHLDAEILLIDEVLAVGDAEFQKKCLKKMSDLSATGKTVIFVSHDVQAVSRICTKGLILEHGTVSYLGNINHAIEKYYRASPLTGRRKQKIASTDGNIILSQPVWINEKGKVVNRYTIGDNPTLTFAIECKKSYKNLAFSLTIIDREGKRIFTSHHLDDAGNNLPQLYHGRLQIRTSLDMYDLAPGIYSVALMIADTQKTPLISTENDIQLEIVPGRSLKHATIGILWHTGSWRKV